MWEHFFNMLNIVVVYDKNSILQQGKEARVSVKC